MKALDGVSIWSRTPEPRPVRDWRRRVCGSSLSLAAQQSFPQALATERSIRRTHLSGRESPDELLRLVLATNTGEKNSCSSQKQLL